MHYLFSQSCISKFQNLWIFLEFSQNFLITLDFFNSFILESTVRGPVNVSDCGTTSVVVGCTGVSGVSADLTFYYK